MHDWETSLPRGVSDAPVSPRNSLVVHLYRRCHLLKSCPDPSRSPLLPCLTMGQTLPYSAPALGNHDGSTINIIRLSSNVIGVRGGQKNSHSSDIFRLIPTPSGEGSDTPLDFLLHRNLVPLSSCVHRHHRHVSDSSARTNSIDINMMRSEGHS